MRRPHRRPHSIICASDQKLCIPGVNQRSDLTDRGWSLIAPFIPTPCRFSRPRKTELREVLNALLLYRVELMPMPYATNGFPPYSAVHSYFYDWCATGLWRRIKHHLVMGT
ncbi:transposase [Rhizobium sp. L51/94]|uniref:transposase n=1 Tax=unclassified Rhizobium TaxID=2613769 RepID=UPI001C5B7671|nr:transposase [Rhizobium sp. L51/94]